MRRIKHWLLTRFNWQPKTTGDILSYVRVFFPDAQVEQDQDEQIVIYTGLRPGEGDEVQPFEL
jgi:hypothetical protein